MGQNGTEAKSIDIGSFVNADCLAAALLGFLEPLHIVCAGTDGQVTGEDVLFAGCLTDRLLESARPDSTSLSDTAAVARGYWQQEQSQRSLSESLQETQGGRNLRALGYERDIELAAVVDSIPIRAVYAADQHLITSSRAG